MAFGVEADFRRRSQLPESMSELCTRSDGFVRWIKLRHLRNGVCVFGFAFVWCDCGKFAAVVVNGFAKLLNVVLFWIGGDGVARLPNCVFVDSVSSDEMLLLTLLISRIVLLISVHIQNSLDFVKFNMNVCILRARMGNGVGSLPKCPGFIVFVLLFYWFRIRWHGGWLWGYRRRLHKKLLIQYK